MRESFENFEGFETYSATMGAAAECQLHVYGTKKRYAATR